MPFPTRPEWKHSTSGSSSLGPHRVPRRKGGENRAKQGPSRVECVYSTSFSDATTLLIAEKKMTSLVWPGARATLSRGLRVPVRSLAHCEHSGFGEWISLLSKLPSSKHACGRAGFGLEWWGTEPSQCCASEDNGARVCVFCCAGFIPKPWVNRKDFASYFSSFLHPPSPSLPF